MSDLSREVTSPIMGATLPRRKRRTGSTSLQLGNYRILGLISRGGTCGVYLASHVDTEERVALKILDPHWGKHDDIVERMFDEYKIASLVSHEGLLEIKEANRTANGTPYLVMELLDGENLGELIERGLAVVGAIASIGAQIAMPPCRAISAATYPIRAMFRSRSAREKVRPADSSRRTRSPSSSETCRSPRSAAGPIR